MEAGTERRTAPRPITSFSTLYAGHVLEGEGIGFDGIPHDDCWYDNDRLAQAFGDAGFSDW